MRFRVIAVGSMDKSMREAAEDYTRRIGRYLNFEVVEVAGSRGTRDPELIRKREGEGLLKAAGPDERLVAVTRAGKPYDSRALAAKLERWREEARDAGFVIGGSAGFDPRVLDRSDETLSLSQLTLPHDLARLVLLEQIYRCCTILRGEPYHKGPS